MRAAAPLAAAALLAGCGGAEPLSLPSDPIDRAATCAIVAAAEARAGAAADVARPLPLETQGRILHYTLLAASEEGRFSAERARAANARMQALQEQVTSGDWQPLVPACRQAFPVAAQEEARLPESRFEAQIACVELAQFLVTALEPQKSAYAAELNDYRRLRRELNDAMGAGLRRDVGSSLKAQGERRDEALAEAATLGPPVAVMNACLERF